MDISFLYSVGIVLVAVGIIVIVAALILASRHGGEGAEVKGAGVIMIGPIPIIFGTDKKSVKIVIVLALALMIVVLAILVVYYLILR